MKEKKNEEKISSKRNISLEDILNKSNGEIIEFIDGIKNLSERNSLLKELINYLENCLLDRDAGKPGPKLIEQLKEKIKKDIDSVKEYKLEELIWWKGSDPMLLYLFDLLNSANLIDKSTYDKRYSIIAKHFRNLDGNLYKNQNLSSVKQNMKLNKDEKPKGENAEKIESVLRDLRNLLKEQTEMTTK